MAELFSPLGVSVPLSLRELLLVAALAMHCSTWISLGLSYSPGVRWGWFHRSTHPAQGWEESNSHQRELGYSWQCILGVSPALCECGANTSEVPQEWLWPPSGGKASLLFAPLPTFSIAPLLPCNMLVTDLMPYTLLSPTSGQVRHHSQSLTSTEWPRSTAGQPGQVCGTGLMATRPSGVFALQCSLPKKCPLPSWCTCGIPHETQR